ncbi:DUF7927 domain-containing protein, partial [Desertihabitans aurantiacus]
MTALFLAVVIALVSMGTVGVGVAHAATVYEIEGEWETGTPDTVGRGDVVTGIWRVNVNDDAEAPANDPVENVLFSVTLDNGVFRGLPDVCLTGDEVDPQSSLSEDNRTLTCNLGTVEQGSAVVIQTPVVVDGETGEQLTATGEINGQEEPLPPLDIVNEFGLDIQYGQNTGTYYWNDDYTQLDVDLNWSLRLAAGSDPGPDSVTYRLQLTETNNSTITVGTGVYGDVGCGPFNAYIANGHPWSELPNYPADQQTSFVDSCTLTPVAGQPGVFDLTLDGINYDLATVPTKDSAGDPLPTDWSYIASGSLWFSVATDQAGSISLQTNAPTYESTTGLTSTDLAENNTTTKSYTLPGRWAAPWYRGYTGAGGTNWDDTYRVSAGETVAPYVNNNAARAGDVPPNQLHGNCLVFDTAYSSYASPEGERVPMIRGYNQEGGTADELENPPTIEYYVGAVGDPDDFVCGSDPANWVDEEPADLETVQAVRIIYPHSLVTEGDWQGIQLLAYTRLDDNLAIGQDVWMFGSILNNGVWEGPGERWDTNVITPTPGARYPFTNGRRDILRIIYATPTISKAGDRQVVRPGVPATFTLTYSANGAGAIPDAVDDYEIVDTLPVGMTYVAGSATPEPEVTTNGEGQQVLTWSLDQVPTNTPNMLTYQAVASDSVTPGETLTNTATSSLAGQTSLPASAQVTIASSGYTLLGKSTEQWFMNNPDGEGNSTGSWTVNLRSSDPLPQAFTDTIDILPYNGDGRGTDFQGTYSVTSVDAPEGATVYYTTADRETLSDDPADDVNGAPNAPSDIWSTTPVPNPTAIRVIGGQLNPGEAFAFDVNIATEGAAPGDVWVNRAQSRAEHTRLVMRTSEPLTMGTMYSASLKKYVQDSDGEWHDAQDASDYPVFRIGDEVTYRIGVTNTGQGTLQNVQVEDDQFEQGSFLIEELAPGDVEYHEFTATIEGSFETSFVNVASATADQPEDSEDPVLINSDPAGVEVANYRTVKTSAPSGEDVQPGDTVTYTVTVTQEGSYPATAEWGDDLSDVLDDATIDEDSITASTGTAVLDGDALTWSGEVGVGEVATVTYEAVVKSYEDITDGGNWILDNVVFSDGCAAEGDCNPPENPIGTYTQAKTSDPAPGSSVGPGDVVTYSVTVAQVGEAGVPDAFITDDLSGVLDDATYNGDAAATSGAVVVEGEGLRWDGELAVGDVVTITYSVTVTGEGDMQLDNVLGDNATCVPAPDENPDCRTTHPIGKYIYSKVSEPETGSTVAPGDVITYTVTVTQQGPGEVPGARLTDDMSDVLDDASYNGDVEASIGEAVVDGETLSWTGDLAVGAVETITYSVTVTDTGDDDVTNAVTSDDPRGTCDEAVGCEEQHFKGRFIYSKVSDPVSGSTVEVGDVITYTVTVTQQGQAAVDGATLTDDLSDVLD